MGMGGAYIGVADDYHSLFLNPAGLAGVKNAEFNLASIDATVSSDSLIYARNALGGFGSFGVDTINALMGQNHFLQAQGSASIVMPNVGFGYLYNRELGIEAQNQSLPSFTVINVETHVIQGGAAFGIGRKRRGKAELRVGLGGKMVIRKGGYRAVPFADLPSLSLAYLDTITGPAGIGFGFDLGLQFVYRAGKEWTLMAGTAFTNFGDIAIPGGAMPLYGDLGAGIAARYEKKGLSMLLAWDVKHLTDITDWRKLSHLGIEVGVSMFSFYAGFYQVFPCAGVGLNFWLLKTTLSTYATENGSIAFQDPERRWMLNTTLRLPL